MSESDSPFMKVMAGIAVSCALAVAVVTVKRAFWPEPPIGPTGHPVYVSGWKELARSGHVRGDTDAPVTILEFADFECPICRSFTTGPLRGVEARYGDSLRIVFRHWPLSYHRFAYPAARAAECAAAQGRFFPYHDLLYQKQDSLGLKSFLSFAVESGVPDTAAFRKCNSTSDSIPEVSRDIAAAKQAGGTGTPTILVNGNRLPGAPDSTTFDSVVTAAMREHDAH